MSELDKAIRDNIYKNKVQQDISHIYNLLRDYIPRDCERKVYEELYRAFEQNGIELTSRLQREQYEAVMKLCADGAKYEEILKAGKPDG